MIDPNDWGALDQAHVWHPYTQHGLAPTPLPIIRAEGAYLHGPDGRPIFDAISSWWVTLHGHCHPAISAAIAAQAARLEQVIFAGFTHEPAARLAAELIEILPRGLSRIFYSDNGSTAVEVALKMALQYWRNLGKPRPALVALENAYHGDTFGAMSASGRGLFTEAFEPYLFEVIRLPDPTSGDVVKAFRDLIAARGADLGALIVEPLLLGAGGMIMWPAEVLRQLANLARANGTLLVADEVLTGFGRTGPLFASAGAGITPDIICLSKGLTGGFLPLGVTAATEEIFSAFVSDDRRKTFFHGHSYTANPIACAAARANLRLLDHECERHRDTIAIIHQTQLDWLATFPGVSRPRVLGTVAAFDLADQPGYLAPAGRLLAEAALKAGILLRPLGNVVYLLPPYCATVEDLERAYAVIRRYLEGNKLG